MNSVPPHTPVVCRFTFSIRTLLFATAMFAIFLGLRRNFVYDHIDHFMEGGLYTTIGRARCVPPLIAGIASLYVCAFAQGTNRKWRALILTSALVGASVAGLTATILGIEIAEAVRKSYHPRYWNWASDWPQFALEVIGREALIGAIMGIGIAVVCLGISTVVNPLR